MENNGSRFLPATSHDNLGPDNFFIQKDRLKCRHSAYPLEQNGAK
jgi:hypothetical protein